MISALLQYAEDRGLASLPGYSPKRIKWVLAITPDGHHAGLLPSDRVFVAPDLTQPETIAMTSQRGAAAHFLVASLSTFTGWTKDEATRVKEAARRETMLALLDEAAAHAPMLVAVRAALASPEWLAAATEEIAATAKLKPTDLATIRMGDSFPVENPEWRPWWEGFRATLSSAKSGGANMICFGTGEPVTPAPTHAKVTMLKGVGLSQPHAPLVTFDKEAFLSYGLSQGENAAMSEATAKAYAGALDALLASGVRLGGAVIVHWYTGPAEARAVLEEDDPLGAVTGELPPVDAENAAEERRDAEAVLRRTIERVRTGEHAPLMPEVRFCVAALSGAGGRVMVRDFLEGPVLDLLGHVETWFKDLALVGWSGTPRPPMRLEAAMTAPLMSKGRTQDYGDWIKPAGAWRSAMWRAAIAGEPIPVTAALRALAAHTRSVVRGDLTDDALAREARPLAARRLALVKAHLVRNLKKPMTPGLDPRHPSPAYHCGRLLSLYDSLQRAALGDVGAGVVQRFYGGALTNPGAVFGQLSRMAQAHLGKLEGGLPHLYESRIAEAHAHIAGEYPGALSSQGQALFALGYWHQIAATNAERAEATAAKRARDAAPAPTDEELQP